MWPVVAEVGKANGKLDAINWSQKTPSVIGNSAGMGSATKRTVASAIGSGYILGVSVSTVPNNAVLLDIVIDGATRIFEAYTVNSGFVSGPLKFNASFTVSYKSSVNNSSINSMVSYVLN